MAGGGASSSDNRLIYSIQRTYIITPVLKSGKAIITCDQRIDIPTIEPLLTEPEGVDDTTIIVPCIELTGDFWNDFDLTLETNEGVTVLPVKILPGDSPYGNFRYVLVLPRGATGVKSCKIIYKATAIEVQHNFTFGIMPPPYNYDNALFADLFYNVSVNSDDISTLKNNIRSLTDRVTALENKAGG